MAPRFEGLGWDEFPPELKQKVMEAIDLPEKVELVIPQVRRELDYPRHGLPRPPVEEPTTVTITLRIWWPRIET